MANLWQMVPLGQLLAQSEEMTEIRPDRRYRQVTVRLWGEGVVLRDEVSGTRISAKKRRVARVEQFILSRIDARNGAFGLVPQPLDGAVVSNDFPAFNVNRKRLEPHFLEWLSKTEDFVNICRAASEGTTNRVRLKVDRFLEVPVSLPPLDEQRRIVARIEELAALIGEAQGLRVKAREEAEAFERSYLDEVYELSAEEFGTTKLADACTSITDGDHLTPNYTEQGIRFIFVGNVSSGHLHFDDCKYVDPDYYASLSPQRKPEQGDILYSAVGATLGIPAIVDQDEGFCFQRHVAIIKPDRNRLDSTYLWHSLRSNTMHRLAWAKTTGSAQPTVPLRAIRDFPIPVPPLSEQRRVVAYLDGLQAQVDELAVLQAATEAELDALLPSVLDRAFRGEL
jgi:type I restriction enzyme S subunit